MFSLYLDKLIIINIVFNDLFILNFISTHIIL